MTTTPRKWWNGRGARIGGWLVTIGYLGELREPSLLGTPRPDAFTVIFTGVFIMLLGTVVGALVEFLVVRARRAWRSAA